MGAPPSIRDGYSWPRKRAPAVVVPEAFALARSTTLQSLRCLPNAPKLAKDRPHPAGGLQVCIPLPPARGHVVMGVYAAARGVLERTDRTDTL
jgi:hypothetical protein